MQAGSTAAMTSSPEAQQKLLSRLLAGACQSGTWLCIADADCLEPEAARDFGRQLVALQASLAVRHSHAEVSETLMQTCDNL